jgi:hypothetical protein
MNERSEAKVDREAKVGEAPHAPNVPDDMSDDELAAALAQRLSADKHVHGRRKPTWDANDLNLRLRQYDRTPFLELLQHWLENSPTLEDIKALAKRSPDRYIAALSSLAKIAGFSEKTESTVNLNMNIGRMSDSQLADALRAAQAELQILDVPFTAAPDEVGDGHTGLSNAAKLPALVVREEG